MIHDFKYRRNELYCEGVPVRRIAEDVGTPLYIYSAHTILERFWKIKKAFQSIDPVFSYSVKANSNTAILRLLQRAGAGFDVVSGGELYRVLSIGADPSTIVYTSVGKTAEEMAQALRAGILCFNVESEAELALLEDVCAGLNRTAAICLRLNPGIDPKTHRFIATGRPESKFGIDAENAERLILNNLSNAEYPHLRFSGIHMHIGSQVTQSQPFVQAVRVAARLIRKLQRRGVQLRWLNLGGGLGITYKNEKPQTARDFARAVLPLIKPLGVELILEPGRFIVGNAGILVTSVVFEKATSVKRFVIVDAAMNDLLRPSLYGAHHEIQPVHRNGRAPSEPADVVGAVCESGDFLGKDRPLPRMEPGELLSVFSAGAYGFVMSSNYNSRPRPAEVLVMGDKYHVVRRRERPQDLIRGEQIPDVLSV